MKYTHSTLAAALALVSTACSTKSTTHPNVIIILSDDQGYEDLGCYGSPLISTPNIDALASSGLQMKEHYATMSVSSASRAGLLTGRNNDKNGVHAAFWPSAGHMSLSEITMAEVLKTVGYHTACIGKWHLGDRKKHLPIAQGFDYFYGIPYSNDMYIGEDQELSPEVLLREGYTIEQVKSDQEFVLNSNHPFYGPSRVHDRVPLFKNDKIIEYPCDQATLTQRYFDQAISFIENCNDEPFFAYITPAMPHIPLYASEQFKGKSKRGLYGDCVEEIDYNVGRLMSYLEEKGLLENTIVIYSSDNGPWVEQKERGGSAYPLRDGKFSKYEGGVRVPFIVSYKGILESQKQMIGISRNIDVFPTIMDYCGVDVSSFDIDGESVRAFWEGRAENPVDMYVYYHNGQPYGVRKNEWVYLPHSGQRWEKGAPELYKLDDDISQAKNVFEEYPEKVAELTELLESYRK